MYRVAHTLVGTSGDVDGVRDGDTDDVGDGVGDLETLTVGVTELETLTVGVTELETLMVGVTEMETLTVGVGDGVPDGLAPDACEMAKEGKKASPGWQIEMGSGHLTVPV